MSFIGRGEVEAKAILQVLFPNATIREQVPIESLIKAEDYEFLDQEIKNHNFDLVLCNGLQILVIEVNYHHKEKAAKKWRKIFTKLLTDNDKIPITINDYNCEYLFSDSIKLKKKHPWGAYIDIINELQRQGINPHGSLS